MKTIGIYAATYDPAVLVHKKKRRAVETRNVPKLRKSMIVLTPFPLPVKDHANEVNKTPETSDFVVGYLEIYSFKNIDVKEKPLTLCKASDGHYMTWNVALDFKISYTVPYESVIVVTKTSIE